MQNIIQTYTRALGLFWLVVTMVAMAACESDDEVAGPPVITEVRNYAASPDDTVITTLNTGQWVVLMGKNLSSTTQVLFAGTPASINTAMFSDESLVVQIPSIPFASVPAEELNKITVLNSKGSASISLEIIGEPIITRIRSAAPAPDDVILEGLAPGQEINIVGFNLRNATEISFQGVLADLNTVVYTDTSALVTVPADLSGGNATLANMVTYTNAIGTGIFDIAIFGPPSIIGISYEVPREGDEVFIVGNNFSQVESLIFAGTAITTFEVSADERIISFIAPALTQSGPVVITTPGGSFTTAYNVNDVATGAISNFEWDGAFRWDWWGGGSLAVDDASRNEGWIADFPEYSGNPTKFMALNVPVLAPGGGADWNTAIRITGGNAGAWFPSEDNLNDAASVWALKFEMNVSENWNGGTLVIRTSNPDYMVRFEPWQVTPTRTEDFKTEGWITVTVPLNAFRRNDASLGDGRGDAITTVDQLFNQGTITSDLLLYLFNYGTTDTKTRLRAAFDNFRVVRR